MSCSLTPRSANAYQAEESEKWIGEWIAQRGIREELVLATKFTGGFQGYPGAPGKIKVNTAGNSAKSLYYSVEASLKKLQTSYLDLVRFILALPVQL